MESVKKRQPQAVSQSHGLPQTPRENQLRFPLGYWKKQPNTSGSLQQCKEWFVWQQDCEMSRYGGELTSSQAGHTGPRRCASTGAQAFTGRLLPGHGSAKDGLYRIGNRDANAPVPAGRRIGRKGRQPPLPGLPLASLSVGHGLALPCLGPSLPGLPPAAAAAATAAARTAAAATA